MSECPVGSSAVPSGKWARVVSAGLEQLQILFTMPWAACEAAHKHAGGEKRNNNIEEMLLWRECCSELQLLQHQRCARGRAPTPATPTRLCSVSWVPWASLWGHRGTSLSPRYLVLPNQQDGTVKVAVTASEVAVKALGLPIQELVCVFCPQHRSWSCWVPTCLYEHGAAPGRTREGAGADMAVLALRGSPWAQKWQGQRAAWWKLQVEELPQEDERFPWLGAYHTPCGACTCGRTWSE